MVKYFAAHFFHSNFIFIEHSVFDHVPLVSCCFLTTTIKRKNRKKRKERERESKKTLYVALVMPVVHQMYVLPSMSDA